MRGIFYYISLLLQVMNYINRLPILIFIRSIVYTF
jgi:hypothetical protein